MNAFSLKICLADIWLSLRVNKRRAFACSVTALLGAVLGIVLFCAFPYSWWNCNRCNFVNKIVFGGFFEVLLLFLGEATLISAWLVLFSLHRGTMWLSYPLLAVCSLYFGANCCAAVSAVGAMGIFYLIFLFATAQLLNMLSCFFALEICGQCGGIKRAFFDCKRVIALQCAAVLIKIVAVFAFIRLITALI